MEKTQQVKSQIIGVINFQCGHPLRNGTHDLCNQALTRLFQTSFFDWFNGDYGREKNVYTIKIKK